MGREAICLGSSLQEGFLDTVCGLPEQSGCLPYSLWGSVNWCVFCLSFYHLESLFPALVSEQALRLDGINGSDIVTEFRTQLVFKDLFYF